MGVLPGKLLLQSPVGSSPHREEELILFLILWKKIQIKIKKKSKNQNSNQNLQEALLRPVLEGPCLQPGEREGQSGLWDCVDRMAWHNRPTGV